MKLDNFIETVAQMESNWWLDTYGVIRDGNDHCPIMAVATNLGWEGCDYDDEGNLVSDDRYNAHDAGKFLGLRVSQRKAIMAAADFQRLTPLRRRLLRACDMRKQHN